MEVECVKYQERMDSEQAECRHPADYCRFRTSCIIHFLSREKRKEEAGAEGGQPVATDEQDNDCQNRNKRDSDADAL